jgi:ATP/maltotriose-dependent transcriptional regulator MalT
MTRSARSDNGGFLVHSAAKPALLGRDAVVERLLGAAASTAAGQSSVAVVRGEAGIGKSSLIQVFLSRLGTDVRTLCGRCDELLDAPALGPLKEAFSGTDGRLEQALSAGNAELAPSALLADLATGQPTVLLLEDLHWADDASLDAIRYLVRRLDRVRVLVVLTLRSAGVGIRPPLRALLGELGGKRTHRIDLEPLSVDAVRSFVGESAIDAQYLHTLTGGNPFYLTELLAWTGRTGVPTTVMDAVLARARDLQRDCLEAIEQLSVMPNPVDLTTVQLLGPGLDRLAEAERSGFLELRSGTIRFRQEIVRRAIEQSLPQIRRVILNRNVVDLLLAMGDPEPAALVHHGVEAGDARTVIRFGLVAARQAVDRGFHHQALGHFEAVVPHVRQLEIDERAAVLDDYAWELHLAHRCTRAIEVGEQAVALRKRGGDGVAIVDSLLRVSRYRRAAGDTDGAWTAVEQATSLLEPLDAPSTRAVALACRGMLLVQAGLAHEALPTLREAHDVATAAGRSDLQALAMNHLGVALADAGDPEGIQVLRDSLQAALTSGDHESAATAYRNLADVLHRSGDDDGLAACLDDGRIFTREHGFGTHSDELEVHQAWLSLRRGDWDDAATRLHRLMQSADDLGILQVSCASLRARLLARRGDLEAAHGLVAEAWQRARQQRFATGILCSGAAYAEWAWLAERTEVASTIRTQLSEFSFPPGMGRILGEVLSYLRRAGVTVDPVGAEPDAPSSIQLPEASLRLRTGYSGLYERALDLADTGSPSAATQALLALDTLGATAAASLIRRRLASGKAHQVLPAERVAVGYGAGLTSRQFEVLRLLAEGLTNAEIARCLVVSVRTVDHHVSAVLTKLGAPSRREAVRTASTLGLPISRNGSGRARSTTWRDLKAGAGA